jgi:hypothetical protein
MQVSGSFEEHLRHGDLQLSLDWLSLRLEPEEALLDADAGLG